MIRETESHHLRRLVTEWMDRAHAAERALASRISEEDRAAGERLIRELASSAALAAVELLVERLPLGPDRTFAWEQRSAIADDVAAATLRDDMGESTADRLRRAIAPHPVAGVQA